MRIIKNNFILSTESNSMTPSDLSSRATTRKENTSQSCNVFLRVLGGGTFDVRALAASG